MGSERVFTFELRDGAATRVAADDTLADASRRLPAGSYTTFRTYGGSGVFRFRSHLDRLRESAALRGDAPAVDEEAVRRLVVAALRSTGHQESRVRLTVAPPRLFASIEAFAPRPAADYRAGVRCVTLPIQRSRPRAKDTDFIARAQDAYRNLPPGVEEGLLVDAEGAILEGLSSNFFAILDGRLYTEDERMLSGITRSLVLEVSASRLAPGGRAVRREELPRVAEAFITSASREVLPVVHIDDEPIGDGRVGAETRAIMRGFAERRDREIEPLPKGTA